MDCPFERPYEIDESSTSDLRNLKLKKILKQVLAFQEIARMAIYHRIVELTNFVIEKRWLYATYNYSYRTYMLITTSLLSNRKSKPAFIWTAPVKYFVEEVLFDGMTCLKWEAIWNISFNWFIDEISDQLIFIIYPHYSF